MSAKYPLSVHRHIERRWAERLESLRQIRGMVVAATERSLQRSFSNEDLLTPVPVRTAVGPAATRSARPRD